MTWVTPVTWTFALVIALVLAGGWLISTGRLPVAFNRPYPQRQSTGGAPGVEWDA